MIVESFLYLLRAIFWAIVVGDLLLLLLWGRLLFMSQATDRLAASFSKLSGDVDKLVSSNQAAIDAVANAAADQVDQIDAKVAAALSAAS